MKKIILYISLTGIALLTAILVIYKPGSSNGRLLIYKVSTGMLRDNLLFGVGQGQFKVQYNQNQSAYFASHNINNNEAILADNTFYAFNDIFQLVIENGVLAFLFLAAIIFLLIKQVKQVQANNPNKYLLTAATASLICILTGSLFSYPLQVFPITVQAIICLAIINSFQPDNVWQIKLSANGSKIIKGALVLVSILLVVHFTFYLDYSSECKQAVELKKSGFRQKAIEKYKALSGSYLHDGSMYYLYARELYNINQLNQAKEKLEEAKKSYCTNEVYILSGAIESELKNYPQAEADYKMAVYMVPNRMVSRSELFNYYVGTKDTVNAIYWGNSILNMPVKIPSAKTNNILAQTKKALAQLSKATN